MKRFKLIFHICYVVIALVVLYFSIDVLLNTEAYLSKIKLSSYLKFPKYVMATFMFLSLIMLTEFLLERLNNRQVKGKTAELEQQILELKAKLYDQSQEEINDASSHEPEEEEDHSEDQLT